MEINQLFEQSLLFNKLIIESMSDGIFCIDNNLRCTFINSSALKMLGYTYDDCIGNNLHSLIHGKEMRPDDGCPICKTLINKAGCIVEDEVFWRSDGKSINVRYTSNPIIDDFEFIGVVVLFCDISEQKRTGDDIKRIKTIQESLINGTIDLIWSIDKDYKLISYNRSYFKKNLDLTGKRVKEGDVVLHEPFDHELVKRWKNYYSEAFSGETFTINEHVYNPLKNKMEYALISLAPMYDNNKELLGVACLSKDVTEETSNHIALIESYNELENIFNQSMDIICVIDEEGRFRKISNAGKKILGYKIEELVGKSYFDFIYHEDLDRTREVSEGIMNGVDVTNFENRYVCKNGSLVPMIWSARWDKKVKLMFCVGRDATDKKLAEKRLIQSESFLEEAQRLAKMGSWNFDFKTDKVTWSKELYNIFGTDVNSPDATHGSFISLIDEQDKQLVQHTSKHTQETGVPFNIQYRITTPNGEKRVIEEFGYGEKDTDGKVMRLFGTAQDITERKRTEEKIKEIGWIQSHIVRAPVTRIIGLVSLIKNKLVDETEMEKVLDYLLLSTGELDSIIRDISEKTIITDR